MKELIPIKGTDGKKLVDARMLHSFLVVKRDFSSWLKYRIDQYDFIEGTDYVTHSPNLGNLGCNNLQRQRIDYGLTLDMAKQLCMVENSDKGMEARKYFIECERQAKEIKAQPQMPVDYISALEALISSEKEKLQLQAANNKAVEQLVEAKHENQVFQHVYGVSGYMDLTTASKILRHPKVGPHNIFKFLVELGMIYRNKDRINKPYDFMQQYMKFFRLRPIPPDKAPIYFTESGVTYYKLTVNFKGFMFIAHKILERYGKWEGLLCDADYQREFESLSRKENKDGGA